MKGTRGFSLFLGVGQNEKSSSTSSLKCVYLCWFVCRVLGKKVVVVRVVVVSRRDRWGRTKLGDSLDSLARSSFAYLVFNVL